MNITLEPSELTGTLPAPPSKSVAHRSLICAASSKGVTDIVCPSISEDISATIKCLSALGSKIELHDKIIRVYGGFTEKTCDEPILDCGESGSTLRFILPLACMLGKAAVLIGRGRLGQRPIEQLCRALEPHGVIFPGGMALPLKINGKALCGKYSVRADVSSQFITGLLLSLPLAGGKSEIITEGREVSAPYIDITLSVQKSFGAETQKTENGYIINGEKSYISPENFTVEGDYSNAAFWLVCGCIGSGKITCENLKPESFQGDKKIIDVLRQMGGKLECRENAVTAYPSKLYGTEIDAEDIPDLVPVLCVAASAASGKTLIYNTARLRKKESDRVESTMSMIKTLGGRIYASENHMEIQGGGLSGGEVLVFGDHRIAMSAAVASVICRKSVTINGAEAVEKSYPDFFRQFKLLKRGVKE